MNYFKKPLIIISIVAVILAIFVLLKFQNNLNSAQKSLQKVKIGHNYIFNGVFVKVGVEKKSNDGCFGQR
jgi:hypothetical protein